MKITSILLMIYFVALGGGATVVSHYCGGDHVFTHLLGNQAEGSCCEDEQTEKMPACDSDDSCSSSQEKSPCEQDCDSSCCEEEVQTFKLPELNQPSRILPEAPVSIDLNISLPYLFTVFNQDDEQDPELDHYPSSPPLFGQNSQALLAVFLL